MFRLVVAGICLATVALAGPDRKSESSSNVKNATAGGYYDGGYGGPAAPVYPAFYPPPPLVDRNVCDLDASVLLVVERDGRDHRDHHDRHRHGRYRAQRVRCSEIANYDEDSCNVCCQNAARRDRNLKNGELFGFLALASDFDRHHDDESGEENTRVKRHASREVDETSVEQANWKPDPQYRDVKCVCCAPKRPLPPMPVYQPPVYPQQPVYGQSAAPAPSYPASTSTSYGQQPAPQAPAPAYQPPVQTYPQTAPQAPANSY